MKLKAGSWEEKIDKPLARFIKKNGRGFRSIKLEKRRNITDNTEIQWIVRDYHKQLYVNKMDNLEEMDKFLEKYKFPRLNQEETENISRPITNNEIQTVIKNFQETKVQDQMASWANSIKHLGKT